MTIVLEQRTKITKPQPLQPQIEHIPAMMRQTTQWLAWQYEWDVNREEWTKIPINAMTGCNGKSNDPTTWTGLEQAEAAWKNGMDGIGFALAGNFTGVDIDNCIQDGVISPFARSVIERLDS